MKYAITIALMLSLSFGLITESFRYQSTARLWEDDYDLLFDPARIPEIEGSRLWTSLSNFVTGGEELFSNGSVPFFLVGGTKNFGKYYPGLVLDMSSDKDALYTGLDDPYGNPIYGEGQVNEVNWGNPDTLGNYQDKTVETQIVQAFDASSNKDFYIGVGTDLNSLRVGLGFMRNTSNSTFTDPNNNFTYNYIAMDLTTPDDTLTRQDTINCAGDNVGGSTENEIILSAWSGKEKLTYGLIARYRMLSYTDEAIIISDSAYYDHPAHPDEDYTQAARIDSSTMPESGSKIDLDLNVFYNYNDYAQGRYYLGFFTRSTNYSDDAMAYLWEGKEEIFDDNTYDTTNTWTYYDGGHSSMGFRAGTKQYFSVSDRFRFAFGLIWSRTSYDDSTSARDTSVTYRVYDDTTTLDTLFDYNYTRWESETWSTLREGSENTFTFPVGVEFNLTETFVFRLGANHSITKQNITTTHVLDEWEPWQERTETYFGTTYNYEDPNAMPDNTEEISKETIPATNYYYGVGWRVTENFQLDLMGFNDLTDMAQWRLSATLHFD